MTSVIFNPRFGILPNDCILTSVELVTTNVYVNEDEFLYRNLVSRHFNKSKVENLDESFLILVRNKIKSGKIQRAKARRTADNRTCQRREIETGEKFIDRRRKI